MYVIDRPFKVQRVSPWLLVMLVVVIGCTPSYHLAPDAGPQLGTVKRVVLLPPEVNVYELSTGGVREKMDEWSELARRNVVQSLFGSVAFMKGATVCSLETDRLSSAQIQNLKETTSLHDVVDASICQHTYGDYAFDDKVKRFDYTLGPEVRGIDSTADVYIIVTGVDHISSSSRKAAQAGAVVLGALLGFGVAPSGGVTAMTLSIVDASTGRVLWHSLRGSAGNHDLRNPASTSALVRDLFKNFPLK